MQWVPGQGWRSNGSVNGEIQTPGALAGDQDVMMISGLRGLGDGEAPAGPSQACNGPFMLVIGLLLGLLAASIIAGNLLKDTDEGG